MAMDKNDLTRLVTKIAKIEDKELPDLQSQMDFINIQIFERKKMLYRALVEKLQAVHFAKQDDKQAADTAEQALIGLPAHVRALKLELAGLEIIKKNLISEYPEFKFEETVLS